MTSYCTEDKQLRGIALDEVLQKRRLGQALNAKEFAVSAGVSYSTARSWFHLGGFPAFHGVVFWEDFVHWRLHQNGLGEPQRELERDATPDINAVTLPTRAARILSEARQSSDS